MQIITIKYRNCIVTQKSIAWDCDANWFETVWMWNLDNVTCLDWTSCAGSRHNMPPPLSSLCGRRSASYRRADRAGRPQRSSRFPRSPLQLPDALTPRWVKRPGDLDLWTFDLQRGVRITCDVGYLCANFSLSMPLCSRLRPDVRDRQSERQTSDGIIA